MIGFQNLRHLKSLDIDYRRDIEAESDCHKRTKIFKTIPFKILPSALNSY